MIDLMGLKIKCVNKLISTGLSIWILSGECGTGILDCKDECGYRRCYSYKYCCLGGGFSIIPRPILFVTTSEIGYWEGRNIKPLKGVVFNFLVLLRLVVRGDQEHL